MFFYLTINYVLLEIIKLKIHLFNIIIKYIQL
jgi:hypothetical protein